MYTLQSIKYKRIEAIIKSVGIEASERDILMLVAEIDVTPQFICAAHVIPVLFKNKEEELMNEHSLLDNICRDFTDTLKENQELKDTLQEVKKHALGIKDHRTSDINTIAKLTKELTEAKHGLLTSEYYRTNAVATEHKYNNLVKHCDKVKKQLEQERRTTTTQSMRIALMEAKVIKINELLK